MHAIVRRVIQLIVVLLVVTFFASLLTSFLPGDPVTTIAPFSSPEDRAQIRAANHLNDNVFLPQLVDPVLLKQISPEDAVSRFRKDASSMLSTG